MTRPCMHVPMRWRRPSLLASALLGALLLISACEPTVAMTPRPGTLRWRVQITDTQRATPVFVAHGMVYLSARDHAVYALDAATGAQRWRARLGAVLAVVSAVADGVVYVMAVDQAGSAGQAGYPAYVIYALNAATGAQRWQVRPHDAPSLDAAVADGLVYFGAWSGPLFALDAATGAQQWQAQGGANLYAAPGVANGVVYAISRVENGSVLALDAATGAQRWQVQAGTDCCSALAAGGGVVYVGANGTSVYALDAATGALRWRFQTGGVYVAPVVANGVAYVGSYDGFLYALNA